MPGKLFTRIYNNKKDDFVDLFCKNFDGDLVKFKKDLKSQIANWETFSDQLQADVVNSDFDFPRLMYWFEDLEHHLAVNKFFPSLENFASLFVMKSFTNNHITPTFTKQSKRELEMMGHNKPNLIGILNGNNISFSNKFIDIQVAPKPINQKEFKIVRIQTQDDYGSAIFTDVKVRKFDRKKFLFNVLTLPEFWRNFHFVSRKKKFEGAIKHPAYEFNKILNSFYTPNKNFTIGNIIGKNKKEIFENVKSNAPLELNVSSFAMHLFFSQPGYILPLTAREKEWSKDREPEMTISISHNEVSLITINYSSHSQTNKQTLEEFSEGFSEREQTFAKHFDLGQYSGGQYLLTTSEEFAFVYETNMIELFDSLSKLDKQANT